MKTGTKLLLTLMLFLSGLPAIAQTTLEEAKELEFYLRSGWVVFFVLIIIFSGLFIFMFLTDRKIARLEKEVNS